MPSEDEQYEANTFIAQRLEGRPLILRPLDDREDKTHPYLPRRPEANPFLGVRGVRLTFEQPELLETQLRAALRTALDHPLKVMFPMVATLDEYRRARATLDDLRAGTSVELEVGVMI